MIGRLKQLLQTPNPADTVNDEEWLRIAVCVLLLEVAKSDNEFGEGERDHIVQTLSDRFDLPEDEAHDLLELARERRAASSDLWKFTNAVNQRCTPDEKLGIMKEIWRVIYADGTLDSHEDYLAHKFARLLNLNHPQLIQAKLAVLNERR